MRNEYDCPRHDPHCIATECRYGCHEPDVAELSAQLASEQAYALELQKALTGLTLGGSEFFVRHGDGFRADIRACVARVNEVKQMAHDAVAKAMRERKAAEAQLAAAEAALPDLAPVITWLKNTDDVPSAIRELEAYQAKIAAARIGQQDKGATPINLETQARDMAAHLAAVRARLGASKVGPTAEEIEQKLVAERGEPEHAVPKSGVKP